ncbi:type II toxin-antitoxin system Phd/YefM family antitoxin [Aulosira sp. FACHB-113]|nr:type II toxin-antitoxin system Phd/YefM family antitoxin [Aulosira sp. FACHB-113]
METVNIDQAQTNFTEMLSRVELGEKIIISNQGIAIAKLVPFRAASNRSDSLGQDRGLFIVPEDFTAPLPEEILVAFEGNEQCKPIV